MAERLQESVEIIRRDRDRSREFLADVSHELRTPIAALRTFNELLVEGAGDDPTARKEFLETSRAQLERLDWLAQNLLELSKLDSGLVLLDLRPRRPPLVGRAGGRPGGTTARRRGVELTMDRPDAAIQIRHDPRADRPGRHEPRRQRDQVHAARRPRRRSRVSGRADGGATITSPTPASASSRPSCRGSSTGSSAARAPARPAAAAAGSAWRSSGASSRCTAARSRSRAGSAPGPRSGSRSRTQPRPPAADDSARVAETSPSPAPEPEPGARTLGSDMTDQPPQRPAAGRRRARRRPDAPTAPDTTEVPTLDDQVATGDTARPSTGRTGPRSAWLDPDRPAAEPSPDGRPVRDRGFSPHPSRRAHPVDRSRPVASRSRAERPEPRGIGLGTLSARRCCRRCSRRAAPSLAAAVRPAPSSGRRAPARRRSGANASRGPLAVDDSSAVVDAAAKVSPAVVRITRRAASTTDQLGGTIPETGVGSGIIFDPNGWILTNRHVVDAARRVQLTVELKDGREFTGTVYGIDTLTDLAIVKVDGDRPAGRRRSASRTTSRSASSRSRSAARSGRTRTA